jgi:thiosulfate/3-mercaptopyruvate sulfurtransferase
MSLVETDWLNKNINNVKIIDCSWHMPQTKRDGFEEFKNQHIPNSIFFDLDNNSKKDTNLPHMLVEKNNWEKIVSEMGIKNEDQIVIYDNSDVVSSCRCWFNFIYFGHDPKLIHVLNGGLKKWVNEKREVTKNISIIQKSRYKSFEKKDLVKSKELINKNIYEPKFKVIDARSKDRFLGKIPEPRKGLRSGSIKNSFCIPFNECLNTDKTFKNQKNLKKIFETCLKNTNEKNIVFSCGSGVTACVLALAYSLINDKYLPCIYDGSWAEYGII